MPGDIKVGMEFGTYNSKLKQIERKYKTEYRESAKENSLESDCLFRDKTNGSVRGNAYRQQINYDDKGNPRFSDAIIFIEGYQYATSARNAKDLDKFDYIQGNKVYAIDINGNGKVDEGEIFEGLLNRTAYKSAKDDGDLSKYQYYKNKFTYNWLK